MYRLTGGDSKEIKSRKINFIPNNYVIDSVTLESEAKFEDFRVVLIQWIVSVIMFINIDK